MTETKIDAAALARLKSMIGGDVSDLADLVSDFIESAPSQIAEMRSAASAGDQVRLRIAAHSCKSNARDLGASVLSDLCAALELQSRNGDVEDPSSQIDAIEQEAMRAIVALDEMDLNNV